MIGLSDVRDWLKTIGDADHYHIGKIDNKKDRSIGVYQREAGTRIAAIGGFSSYSVKRVTILVHWTNNAKETEEAANDLLDAIIITDNLTLNGHTVYFIQALDEEPVDVSTDANGVYERVIRLDIYYERRQTCQ